MTPDTPARPSEAISPRGLTADENELCMALCSLAVEHEAREIYTFCLGFRYGIQEKDALAAQLTEANRRLAIAREGLESVQHEVDAVREKDYGLYSLLWDLTDKTLAQISAEGQDERG